MQVTDFRRELLADFNGLEIINAYKEKIPVTDGMNRYQIQEACMSFAHGDLKTLLKPHELGKMQEVAFERSMLIQTFFNVIAIAMRDALFKDRNISITNQSARPE